MTEPSQPDTDSSTPVEWKAVYCNVFADGRLVARTRDDVVSFDEALAYAQFIVRAANNHAKLLAALERILGESHNPVVGFIARDAIEESQS